ncbi:hypothetical protein HDU97_007853, partial [Phlyctochytrium planicorne]
MPAPSPHHQYQPYPPPPQTSHHYSPPPPSWPPYSYPPPHRSSPQPYPSPTSYCPNSSVKEEYDTAHYRRIPIDRGPAAPPEHASSISSRRYDLKIRQ